MLVLLTAQCLTVCQQLQIRSENSKLITGSKASLLNKIILAGLYDFCARYTGASLEAAEKLVGNLLLVVLSNFHLGVAFR